MSEIYFMDDEIPPLTQPVKPRSLDTMSASVSPPAIARLDTTLEDYLAKLKSTSSKPLDGIATGAIIFGKHHDPTGEPRILLIQRSSTDSMPNKWEVPGGAVDAGETILAGVTREVREETGLELAGIKYLVVHDSDDDGGEDLDGGYLFHTTRGRRIVKFTFVVEVEDTRDVRLDPTEHQNCIWATEEECRTKRATREDGDVVELRFTTAAQELAILNAFTWRRDRDDV